MRNYNYVSDGDKGYNIMTCPVSPETAFKIGKNYPSGKFTYSVPLRGSMPVSLKFEVSIIVSKRTLSIKASGEQGFKFVASRWDTIINIINKLCDVAI